VARKEKRKRFLKPALRKRGFKEKGGDLTGEDQLGEEMGKLWEEKRGEYSGRETKRLISNAKEEDLAGLKNAFTEKRKKGQGRPSETKVG